MASNGYQYLLLQFSSWRAHQHESDAMVVGAAAKHWLDHHDIQHIHEYGMIWDDYFINVRTEDETALKMLLLQLEQGQPPLSSFVPEKKLQRRLQILKGFHGALAGMGHRRSPDDVHWTRKVALSELFDKKYGEKK